MIYLQDGKTESIRHPMENPDVERDVMAVMTQDELEALPVAFDLMVACRALDIGRTTGYGLAKAGLFPCRVLRVGKSYRVTKADLLRVLGVDQRVGMAA